MSEHIKLTYGQIKELLGFEFVLVEEQDTAQDVDLVAALSNMFTASPLAVYELLKRKQLMVKVQDLFRISAIRNPNLFINIARFGSKQYARQEYLQVEDSRVFNFSLKFYINYCLDLKLAKSHSIAFGNSTRFPKFYYKDYDRHAETFPDGEFC